MFDFARALKEAEARKKPEEAEGYRTKWFLKHINHLLDEGDPTEDK